MGFNYFLIITILFVNYKIGSCQSIVTIPISAEQYPSNCTKSQYFDTVSMQCISCPAYTYIINDRK